jgi:error-prone DNA polymerase
LEDPTYEPPYEHPALKEVLKETLGTIIFQDQVMQVAEAFAGFTPGEADGLRRAMSRKRSVEAMEENREHFIAGAMRCSGVEKRTAERVWEMVSGFAGFGFPKAHATAFGLLAYQSTWLRVNYGREFLCALLNEQPMGFYAPDSLIHEAQRRGIEIRPLDVNASQVQCVVEDGAVRLGLGYVKGAARAEVAELVAERERGGPFRDLGDLAGRVAASPSTLEQLAWSGACDGLMEEEGWDRSVRSGKDGGAVPTDARRRKALWQLGLAPVGRHAPSGKARATGVHAQSAQLALPLALPSAPDLRPLDRWQRLIADYATSGVTPSDHAMAILRPRVMAPKLATSAQLSRLPNGCSVAVAGLVIARQRPGTANGTMFLLFEDEWGVVNLIVPKAVYERRRPLARAEPLLLAHGRLERARGVVNVIVEELQALERVLAPPQGGSAGEVRHLSAPGHGSDEQAADGAHVGASMRAVVPPVQSFAAGRRR